MVIWGFPPLCLTLHGQKIMYTWTLHMCLLSISVFVCSLIFFRFEFSSKKNLILLPLFLTTYICFQNNTCSYKLLYTPKTCRRKLTKQYNIHEHTTSWSIPEYPQGKTYILRRFSNTLSLSPVSLHHQNICVKTRISENALYLRLNLGRGVVRFQRAPKPV